MALARNWREALQADGAALGHGIPNPAIPAALGEWSIPLEQLSILGRQLYEQNVAEAKGLLNKAGHHHGFKIPLDATSGWGPDYIDQLQIDIKNWRAAGVETALRLKEFGAFMSSSFVGKFDKLAHSLRGGTTVADFYLHAFHSPGQLFNSAGVNDLKLTKMISQQRRIFDIPKRRDMLYEIQRYLAEQVYYIYGPSPVTVSAWEPHVKNFAPNLGHDYGGRLMVAWLSQK
jgi:ABC-type transport system substrate-binding protein